ncbi:MAG: hypothetical protein M0T79_14200 [Actinomycetota bacterium]|nr:hypothetical protein [Actinomycetota bacterium]
MTNRPTPAPPGARTGDEEVGKSVRNGASRRDHVRQVVSRLRRLAEQRGLEGIVLSGPAAVAWATGGMNTAIDRALPVDMVWVAISEGAQLLVTTEVELPRILADSDPAASDFSVVAVPWYDPEAFVATSAGRLGAAAANLGSDGHPAFGVDLSDDLVISRMALTDFGREALRCLGRDTAHALEVALKSWRPGVSDREVQAEMVRQLELTGAEAVVAIVAGDERAGELRHPLALGIPAYERMMAVIVSRRGGLNVAATRFVAEKPASAELAEKFRAVRQIEATVLRACSPGATYGGVTLRLVEAYAEVGHPEAWREHWQGGPIGYGTREFELAPGFEESAFWPLEVAPGHALAWNPSLSGGAKVEDTFLVTKDGLTCVTSPIDWPTEEVEGFSDPRPAVLVRSEEGDNK